ncbi:hypothetical protein CkaCkLH20_11054 [Colletotrichum karsti]|uniref:Uncharacterized protein n=1 Tax=Colletotrichum karsti TaxID=1095194 RepID=A0A9P6HUN8_9PEZI|nr:uncharacterized protein CkaCkLH20_11054 [Colletotrichum karsti]KAF9871407.1 hypothetical protein CkaCkLH20_11054 [Colletotrichum karsti]
MNRNNTHNNIVQAEYAEAFAIQNQNDMVQIYCGLQGKRFGANKRNLMRHSLYFYSALDGVDSGTPIYLEDQDTTIFGLYLLFDHRLCLDLTPERSTPFYDNRKDSWERTATLTQMIQLFEMCQDLENEILGTHTYELIMTVCQQWPSMYKKPVNIDSQRDFDTANWCLRSFSEAYEHCLQNEDLRDIFCANIIEGFAEGLHERDGHSWCIFVLDFPSFSSQVDRQYFNHDSGCWCSWCMEDRDARHSRQTAGMGGWAPQPNRYRGSDSSYDVWHTGGEPFDYQALYSYW